MRAPTSGPQVPTVDGLSLATWDLGGDGPSLLLLHPTGFHGRCWAPLADHMADRFHCWALDQRGHGASPPAEDYSWRRFSDDVAATLTALDLDRPLVVGHSLGGGIALMTEALHPGAFRAIYGFEPIVLTDVRRAGDPGGPSDASGLDIPGDLGDPSGLDVPAGSNRMATLARRRRSRFPSRAAAMDNYAHKLPFAHFRADALAAYVDGGFVDTADGAVTLSCDTESEARVFEEATLAGIHALLRPSSTPIYLSCGGQDTVIGARELAEISELVGGASIEVLAGLSHLGPFEDPRRVARAIEQAFSDA